MRISDWSSDVCSSDLGAWATRLAVADEPFPIWSCSRWGLPCRFRCRNRGALLPHRFTLAGLLRDVGGLFSVALSVGSRRPGVTWHLALRSPDFPPLLKQRSEEHTSELQSLMRISYAVFCLKKK